MSDWIVLCDFDGTISVEDVTDSLLERHAHAEWLILEEQWKSGAIGSHDCMAGQIGLLDADRRQLDALFASMRIDRTFPAFVEAALAARIPIRIVSDGLDLAIESILCRHQLEHLPIAANRMESDGGRRWKLSFPHAVDDCKVASGMCKCAQVANARDSKRNVLLIGDGASDFCAAGAVDMVFAKHRLIEHCRAHGLPYVPITGFEDALVLLPSLIEGTLVPVPPAHAGVARKGPLFMPDTAVTHHSQSDRDAALLADEARYCSFGDTVHYSEPPKIFARCEGSYLYDGAGTPFLDLQMWYSAVNFGYANPRLNAALKKQVDTLPQVASQYLHPTKIELAKVVAQDAKKKWGLEGRVHFNVGGSQSVEDSLKIVRNASNGKSLVFAFEGGYHGRTLGASAITSSYRYRRRYGHFDRAQFVEFPYHFRGPKGMSKEEYGEQCVAKFARLFETEYNGVWDGKAGQCEYAAFYVEPIQGTGGYVIPPPNFFTGLKKVLDAYGILLVVDEIQMGFFRTGKLWAIEHFGVKPDVLVFGKALTNGLNPLAGIWAREELINPTVFPPGSTHSTFASNPLGTAVGLETMKMLAETDYESMVMAKGAHFLEGLRDLQKRHPEIGDVDGLGLALRAEICEADGFTPNRKLLDRMVDMGLAGELAHDGKKMGLVLDVGGYYKNVITFAPSLHIGSDEIDLGLKLLDQLLTKAKRG